MNLKVCGRVPIATVRLEEAAGDWYHPAVSIRSEEIVGMFVTNDTIGFVGSTTVGEGPENDFLSIPIIDLTNPNEYTAPHG
jgi:hypothetical protein